MTSAPSEQDDPIEDRLDTQTIALRLIATILVGGAAYLLAGLLVPLLLALFVAIALTPVASWLERRARFPRTLSALVCSLGVGIVLIAFAGLIVYQAGTIVQDSDRYVDRFGALLASASKRVGGERLMESIGVIRSSDPDRVDTGSDEPRSEGDHEDPTAAPSASEDGETTGMGTYSEFLDRNLETAASWLFSGIGGLLGLAGGFVIFVAYLFYMLSTRDEWLNGMSGAARRLGMSVSTAKLGQIRQQMVTYLGYLFLVSVCYAVVLSIGLWLIGVPQPLLWGGLTGFLEIIPYFGPIVAATLPTVVALSLGTWWQPAAVLVFYVILQTIEGYVVAPLLYGSAVRINPVTIIFGLLFFGWLWGPVGLMAAMPMMILLRGIILMSPDTPALDALVKGGDQPKSGSRATEDVRSRD